MRVGKIRKQPEVLLQAFLLLSIPLDTLLFLSPPCVLPQLVYMGFDMGAARAALRVFRGNVPLAAQTLAHNGGSLPPDLQLVAEDSSSTPSTSPSDSAGRHEGSEDQLRAIFF